MLMDLVAIVVIYGPPVLGGGLVGIGLAILLVRALAKLGEFLINTGPLSQIGVHPRVP